MIVISACILAPTYVTIGIIRAKRYKDNSEILLWPFYKFMDWLVNWIEYREKRK